MDAPKVTVLMSVYNGEKYLGQAVDSILAQTYRDFEFLIIDDGSTDTSRNILASYPDPRVRVVPNEANIGLTRSLNRGLDLARGQYIARMDADDIAVSDRLEKEVAFLDSHPEIGVVGGNAQVIDGEGRKIGLLTYPETSGRIRWDLMFYNPVSHPAAMIRKDVLARAGGYDTTVRYAQDYELWCRLARSTDLWNLPDIFVLHRMHGGRVSKQHSEAQGNSAAATIQSYMSAILGEEVPLEYVHKILQNRQGESDEVPLLIYRLARAFLKMGLPAGDRQQIRRDAAKKILYRYDLVNNPARLQTITTSLKISPLWGAVMLAYDVVYMCTGKS